VPILQVTAADGRLRGVLFGYACHNTTLGGDFYQVDGDYAGAAQRAFEAAHPGAMALFLMLCGGDQNPSPRGTVEHVQQHGEELARAVDKALTGPLRTVGSGVRTAHTDILLDFAPHTREQFQTETQSSSPFNRRRAALMLAAYAEGRPMTQLKFPVQAVRLGDDLTLLALGGEVVIDYALRAKKEYPAEDLVVAGYCHDVPCYIPSVRVLREGGYEPDSSMIYYGQPGPLAESVEEKIFGAIHQVMRDVGARKESR
jgi:hypothetical protein